MIVAAVSFVVVTEPLGSFDGNHEEKDDEEGGEKSRWRRRRRSRTRVQREDRPSLGRRLRTRLGCRPEVAIELNVQFHHVAIVEDVVPACGLAVVDAGTPDPIRFQLLREIPMDLGCEIDQSAPLLQHKR